MRLIFEIVFFLFEHPIKNKLFHTFQLRIYSSILTCPNLWYRRKSSALWTTSSAFQLMNCKQKTWRLRETWRIYYDRSLSCRLFTFVLNESTTDAALPVQLIRINPKHRAAWAKPKRASTLAPAPSPNPMTYLTCKKSNTVTKSSPSVFNDGKLNLNQNGNLIIQRIRKKGFSDVGASYQKEIKIGEKLRFGKCISVVSMTRNIDMNETWTFFNFRHTWAVYELLERCICGVAIGKKRRETTKSLCVTKEYP